MAAYTEGDADELYGTIEDCSQSIDEQNRKKSELDDRISRLKAARRVIRDMKDEAGILRADFEAKYSELAGQTFWTGEHRTLFLGTSGSIVCRYAGYCSDLDMIHDALDDEITRLKNNIADIEGSISWLRKIINNCWNWLDKLLN